MVISKIGVLSCGKVMGALYALMGLLFGALLALMSLVGVGAFASGGDETPAFMGAIFGVGAIIFLPLFYGIGGFIGGMIMAAIYNVVTGIVGGLELDVR